MEAEGSSSSSGGGGGGAGGNMNSKRESCGQEAEVRKGPWTMEEDLILVNYIANHGEGVWNNLARCAGLNRTGKSCRLRWLNYLRPDVRRGNITPQEQFLIMELHSRWGNRWSKIARQLPGRTDNEIKNYWRTRIQKRVKQSDQPMDQLQNAAAMLADEPSPSYSRNGSAAVAPPSQYQPDYELPYFNDAAAGGGGGGFEQFQLSPDSGEHFWAFEDFWTTQSPDDDYMK